MSLRCAFPFHFENVHSLHRRLTLDYFAHSVFSKGYLETSHCSTTTLHFIIRFTIEGVKLSSHWIGYWNVIVGSCWCLMNGTQSRWFSSCSSSTHKRCSGSIGNRCFTRCSTRCSSIWRHYFAWSICTTLTFSAGGVGFQKYDKTEPCCWVASNDACFNVIQCCICDEW